MRIFQQSFLNFKAETNKKCLKQVFFKSVLLTLRTNFCRETLTRYNIVDVMDDEKKVHVKKKIYSAFLNISKMTVASFSKNQTTKTTCL